ncbi:ABC transporter substrate-binding protein [Streptomyces sp. MS19]|uniref:ABC transporter substrate-binding protein n=1 Tax=Streptomyces sp. MS19 TaxID=3385972 RepID=UPI0039A3B8B5
MRRTTTGRRGARRLVRGALTAGTAAVLATALAACGIGEGFEGEPELSDGKVTISVNWWGADARTQATEAAIELFEDEYPNIDVEPQFADWSGYWDRLATTTAAGEMPDVSQFDQLYLSAYAQRGALLDLDRVSEFLDPSVLGDQLLDSGRVRGSLYAVPTGGTASAIIINTTLFEQYGVPVPDTGQWTWEDFERAGRALTEASDGEVHGISPWGGDAITLTVWARQHGAQVFDDEGNVALPADVLAGYWQEVRDLIDSGAAPGSTQLAETGGLPLDQGDLVTGRTAMKFIPAGMFNAYQSAAPDYAFSIADWPTDPDTHAGFQYLKPTMYWAISSTTQHPAEAALLVDFFTNDPRVGELFGVDRGEPGNPRFRELIEPDLDPGTREAMAFSSRVTADIRDTPPITPPGASDLETVLGRYNQQVIFGDATPEEAAEDFLDELNDSVRAAS